MFDYDDKKLSEEMLVMDVTTRNQMIPVLTNHRAALDGRIPKNILTNGRKAIHPIKMIV